MTYFLTMLALAIAPFLYQHLSLLSTKAAVSLHPHFIKPFCKVWLSHLSHPHFT